MAPAQEDTALTPSREQIQVHREVAITPARQWRTEQAASEQTRKRPKGGQKTAGAAGRSGLEAPGAPLFTSPPLRQSDRALSGGFAYLQDYRSICLPTREQAGTAGASTHT